MKEIVSKEIALGSDGLAKAALGADQTHLIAQLEVKYPLEKVVEPVLTVVNNMIDKIEQLIPGDQKAYAEKLKAEAKEDIMKLLATQLAAPAVPAEVQG